MLDESLLSEAIWAEIKCQKYLYFRGHLFQHPCGKGMQFTCTVCSATLGEDWDSVKLHNCFVNSTQLEVFPDGSIKIMPNVAGGAENTIVQDVVTTQLAEVDATKIWAYNETIALINSYKNHLKDFANTRKRTRVWSSIAMELAGQGIQVTTMQCLNKWKNLLKTYRSVLDNIKKTGSCAMRFQFFDVLYELIGDKPNTGSQILGSNIQIPESETVIIESGTMTETQQQPDSDIIQELLQTYSASTNKKRGQLTAFVYDYFTRKEQREKLWEEEREQRYEEKERRREERHRKKMEMEQKKLQLLSELLKK